MLKVFRHKGVAKKVLWVVSGIIIISFGFGFGMSGIGEDFNINQTAGKVFGKKISLKEYKRTYQNTRDQAVMMHGANVEKILSMMDLDNETWTRVILLKEAEERGIKAADMEVIRYIQTIPFFQREGQFDKMLYSNIIKNVFRREPRDFEEGLRDQIKIMKIFAPKLQAINLSDDIVRKEYEHRNQKVQVNYTLIAPDAFAKDITTDAAELTTYFNTHRDTFLEPESVNATVLTIALDPKASKEDKDKAADKADALFKKLGTGANLAAAAKEYGAEIKETGAFNMNAPSETLAWSFELLQQIFEAKAGDILKPTETPAGYLIVKVLKKEPAFTPAFDKIKDKIEASVIKEKASKIAAEKAAELQKNLAAKISGGMDFSASAKELKLDVKQTPFFAYGDYVPEIGISDDFSTAAFALNKENNLSAVVLTSRGPAILSWAATQPIDEKKFEEVKKDFQESLLEEERMRVTNDVVTELREKAKLENYIEKISSRQKTAMDKMRVK